MQNVLEKLILKHSKSLFFMLFNLGGKQWSKQQQQQNLFRCYWVQDIIQGPHDHYPLVSVKYWNVVKTHLRNANWKWLQSPLWERSLLLRRWITTRSNVCSYRNFRDTDRDANCRNRSKGISRLFHWEIFVLRSHLVPCLKRNDAEPRVSRTL